MTADNTFRVLLTLPAPQTAAGKVRVPSAELTRAQAERLWRSQIQAGGPDVFGPDRPGRTVIVAEAEYQRAAGGGR